MQPFSSTTKTLLMVALFVSFLMSSGGPSWAGASDPFSTAPQGMTADMLLATDIVKPINADMVTKRDVEPVAVPPARVDLASDYSSAIVTDQVASDEMMHYLIRGIPGQRLRVTLDAVPSVVNFALHGMDDRQVYRSLAAESTEAMDGLRTTQEWSGILPSEQDYLLSVSGEGEDAYYMISLELFEPADYLQYGPAEVHLMEGKHSGMVSGRVDPAAQHRYRIPAEAGQSINLELRTDDPAVKFGLYGLDDGRTYKWLYDNASAWSLVAPSSQDYLIIIATDGEPTDYSLVVTRP